MIGQTVSNASLDLDYVTRIVATVMGAIPLEGPEGLVFTPTQIAAIVKGLQQYSGQNSPTLAKSLIDCIIESAPIVAKRDLMKYADCINLVKNFSFTLIIIRLNRRIRRNSPTHKLLSRTTLLWLKTHPLTQTLKSLLTSLRNTHLLPRNVNFNRTSSRRKIMPFSENCKERRSKLIILFYFQNVVLQ